MIIFLSFYNINMSTNGSGSNVVSGGFFLPRNSSDASKNVIGKSPFNFSGNYLDLSGNHLDLCGNYLDLSRNYLDPCGNYLDPCGNYLDFSGNPFKSMFDLSFGSMFSPSKPAVVTISNINLLDSKALIISATVMGIVIVVYSVLSTSFGNSIPGLINLRQFVKMYDNDSNTNVADFNESTKKSFVELVYRLRLERLCIFFALILLLIPLYIYGIYKFQFNGSGEEIKMLGVSLSIFIPSIFVTFLFLEFVPYLVEILENTIGYFLLTTIFPNSSNICNSIFKIRFDSIAKNTENKMTDGKVSYNGGNNGKTLYNCLMSSMTVFNMNTMLKRLSVPLEEQSKKDNKTPILYFETRREGITEENISLLFKNLHWKHMMGHCVWISFASLIATFNFVKSLANYV